MTQQLDFWDYIWKKKKTLIQKDTCIPMFIAALFTIANIWKQPKSPSTDEWKRRSGIYIYRMWELDCEESWVLKNWCFWTMVLEKTLESSLDCTEIQPVHPEGDHPWDFFGRNEAKAETPILWPPHMKSWRIGVDPEAGRDGRQEEKGTGYWNGLPFPSPGDFPSSGIELMSPALQADALTSAVKVS